MERLRLFADSVQRMWNIEWNVSAEAVAAWILYGLLWLGYLLGKGLMAAAEFFNW